ncbi:MAG: 5-carboxymethyl-2-hydroxymuconate isomerase [Ruegeria sp.]
MPHLILDYSANLDDMLDMHGLCVALKDAAVSTGVFPQAGIRVRAHRAAHAVIADGDARHAYIDITIRMAAGRTEAQKTHAIDSVFDAAKVFTADLMASHPFMLSIDLREVTPEHSRKASSIRDYLPPEMH